MSADERSKTLSQLPVQRGAFLERPVLRLVRHSSWSDGGSLGEGGELLDGGLDFLPGAQDGNAASAGGLWQTGIRSLAAKENVTLLCHCAALTPRRR